MYANRLLGLLILLLASPAWAANSFVNAWGATNDAGSSLAINTSTGNQAHVGDIELAGLSEFNAAINSVPSGWSAVVPLWCSGTTCAAVYCKVVTSPDIGASPSWGFSTTAYPSGGIIAIRGAKQSCTVDAHGSGSTGNGANPVAAAISLVTAGDTLIWFAANGATTTGPSSPFALAFSNSFSSGHFLASNMEYKLGLGTGTTGAIGGTAASSLWAAVMIGIAPSPQRGMVIPGD